MYCGVYAIINNTNSRFYIGSSINVIERIATHRSLLRKQKHSNKYLQNDFNKCGEGSFFAWFIEASQQEQLLEREQAWLCVGFDNQYRCYNITPEAGRHPHYERMKSHSVISPEGVETTFVGMRQFCRERNLRFSSFCDMVNGRVPSSQGWRLPKNCHVETGRTLPKTFNVKLKDPCGNIHGPITNLEEFCRIHKLRSSSIRHLLAGKCKSSLGWTLCQ